MDNAIKEALDFAKYTKTINNQRAILKAKVESYLITGYNGGLFTASPELIQFAKLLLDEEKTTHPVIDNNMNPIMIDDMEDFYQTLLGRYTEVTNEYYSEYEKIKNSRTVKDVLNEK